MSLNSYMLILMLASLQLNVLSQSFDIYDESIVLNDFNYNIKGSSSSAFYLYARSVKIQNEVNELLDPIIQLNSSEKLTLKFDILATETSTYAYTFIHCNSNWEYSDITQSEYLKGFFDHYIDDYQYSFNTLSPYVHYQCSFPNEDVQFTKSGNYIILIYDPEKNIPIITKRFMIYEDVLDVKMSVKHPTLAKDRHNKHEVDFEITKNQHLNIIDPSNELKIILQKNDDWNDIITNCKPSFVNSNMLEYDYQGELSFLGGSEYREFDIKSLRYLGKNILSIEKQNIQGQIMYIVNLQEDNIINADEYVFRYDLNGKYVLSVSETKDKNIEGDYALVRFTLSAKSMQNQDIYIYGELTGWNIIEEAKMTYDEKNENYYGFLYLKQGYYNYQYVTIDNDHPLYIENNFSETRNQYSTYVYYTPHWSDYDRLVGISKSTSNSLN